MQLAYYGQTAGIILFMLVTRSAFGTLLITHLGGSDRLAMFLLAIPGLLPFIQIPLSLTINPANGKRFLLGGWACYGVLMALIALIPSLFSSPRYILQLTSVALALAILANLAAATFWFPLLHEIIPASHRGRFFGKLRATWGILLFLVTIISGFFLGKSPTTARFQIIILIGVLGIFLRHILISRIPLQGGPKTNPDDYRDWRQYLKDIFTDSHLKRFYLYFTLLGCCAGFLGHPLVLYMRDLGLTPRDNIIVFGFTTFGTVLALYLGGHSIDRFGIRRVLTMAHTTILSMLFFIALVTIRPPPFLPLLLAGAFALSGMAVAVANLACTTQLFHQAPDRGRVFYLSLINVLTFLGPAFATLTAGIVLGHWKSSWSAHPLGIEINLYQIMLAAAGITTLAASGLLKGIHNILIDQAVSPVL